MKCEWIAVDWGTSRLRVWAMSGAEPIASVSSDRGMAALTPDQFEPTLLSLIDPWLGERTTDVIACGMVGARQGWAEAPYRTTPTEPPASDLCTAPTTDARLRVRIINGLKQDNPADVMRGEETQLAGFLADDPKFDGVVCLPGTHTKWAHISAGEVVSFRTFMTGELFALLSTQSVLRHSVDHKTGAPLDEAEFSNAMADAMSKPEAVAARLFSLRAEGLLHDLDPAVAGARLSGFLIGSELAAARPYWLGRRVVVIGAKRLGDAYCVALNAQGIGAPFFEGDEMSLKGLTAAYLATMASDSASSRGCAT